MQNVLENKSSTVNQQCRKDVWCVWRARGHGKLQSWQFSSRKPILNSILESSYAWPRRQREADLHFYSTPLCCLSKRRKSLANTLGKCQIQTRGCVENCHVRLNDACGHKKWPTVVVVGLQVQNTLYPLRMWWWQQ